MSERLLRCQCGTEHRVNEAQAGEKLECSCGRQLEVPTLRQLRTLPLAPAQVQSPAPERNWSPSHGLILVGAMVLLVGLGLVVFIWLQRPRPINVYKLRPVDTWFLWQHELRQVPKPVNRRLVAYYTQQRPWVAFTLAGMVVVTGIVLLALGYVLLPQKDDASSDPARKTTDSPRG